MLMFIVITLYFGLTSANSKYCAANLCPNGAKHISCGNSGAFSPQCPSDRRLVELSSTDIKVILDNHNMYRNRIASGAVVGFYPAARMATMTWNSELAELASLNVKQCKMNHDSCRSTLDYKYAGQNLAYRASTGNFEPLNDFIEKSVKDWFDEVKDASQADIDKCCNSKPGKTIGHFTQLVTDRAIQVGCAVARYTDKQWKTSLIACNYAFSNVLGMRVYISGKTASGCSKGRNPDYPSLCSTNEQIKAMPY